MKKSWLKFNKKATAFILAAAMMANFAGLAVEKNADAKILNTQDDSSITKVLGLSFENNLNDSAGINTVKEGGTVSYADGVQNGKCLNLGGNGYLDVGTSSKLQPSKITISYWLKANDAWAGEQIIMWAKPNGSYQGEGWYLSANDMDECLEMVVGKTTGQPYKLCANMTRADFYPVGEWVHTVVTWDSTTGKGSIYRNGVEQETRIMNDTQSSVINSTSDTKWLGCNSSGYGYGGKLSAYLDEYEIFDGIASQDEVSNLYAKNGGVTNTEELAQKDYDALSLQEETTVDLDLITKGPKGGSKISWESSNEDIISADGKVTRPEKGQADKEVTLTATITNGATKLTKTFKVKVLAISILSNIKEINTSDILVTDDYYESITKKDVDFLNTFNPDRLLYNFRINAGYSTSEIKEMDFLGANNGATKPYSGWENSLIAGHTTGHYLAAMAQAVANGYGNEKGKDGKTAQERLEYLVSGLKDCQEKYGNGFIFGAVSRYDGSIVPEYQFNQLEKQNASSTWVPWYTMHKILNGLVETYKFTKNEKALEVAEGLSEWVYNRAVKWTSSVQDFVLSIEYGGMNDCLYELYTLAKENGYENLSHIKTAAHKFDEEKLFKKVLEGGTNVINNLHANCTIPKFIGALNRYRSLKEENVSGLDNYLEYAKAFWELVVNHHTYITGGNSECEFFGADDILDKERSNCNCETCNTHNMLKLSKWLFEITGDKKYADYYENTFLNAIMASINEETGMTTYFQPMATGLWKVYCNSDIEKNAFWCCTGTGLENFTKLGEGFYFVNNDDLVVNQYISSEVKLNDKNIKLIQESNIPESDKAKFTIKMLNDAQSSETTIYFRVPDWVKGKPVLKVNGTETEVEESSGFLKLEGNWKDGDEIELKLPLTIRAYTLPDNDGGVYGFKYGPLVLAAELGKDDKMTTHEIGVQCAVADYKNVNGEGFSLPGAYGQTSNLATVSTEKLNVLNTTVSDYISNISKYMVREGNSLNFTLKGTDSKATLKFSPYNRIHDQRYGIYWLFTQGDGVDSALQILSLKEQNRDARVYLSGVGVGYGSQTEGNAETYPYIEENNSEVNDSKTARRAKANGEFSYIFKVEKGQTNYIVCKFSQEDNGKTIKITSNGQVIASETLNNTEETEDGFYTKTYQIPAAAVNSAESYKDLEGNVFDGIRIAFSGVDGAESAWLYSAAYTRMAYGTKAAINSLTYKVDGKSYTAKISNDKIDISIPATSKKMEYDVKIGDVNGLLYVNNSLVDDTKTQSLNLSANKTVVSFEVFAEDHETSKIYTMTITKESPATNIVKQTDNTNTSTASKETAATNVQVYAKNYAIVGNTIILKKGNKVKLKGVVLPSKASQKVTYKTSKKKVATVSSTGLVKAKKKGTAKITVKAKNGKKKVVKIKVVSKKKTNKVLKLKKNSINIKKGKTTYILVKKISKNATDKITYKSSSKAKVKVDTFGKITAKKKGKATITVKCGKAKKTIKVKIK